MLYQTTRHAVCISHCHICDWNRISNNMQHTLLHCYIYAGICASDSLPRYILVYIYIIYICIPSRRWRLYSSLVLNPGQCEYLVIACRHRKPSLQSFLLTVLGPGVVLDPARVVSYQLVSRDQRQSALTPVISRVYLYACLHWSSW